MQDDDHNSTVAINEMPTHNQATSVESFLPPDIFIARLQNEESSSSFKRKSILFSEKYHHSGSFEESPSLPSSPPPGPLISPYTSASPDTSSPRYSWLFSSNGAEGINVTNLSIDPPELPLSLPPGKPLSPRTSNFVNTDPLTLNLIRGSNTPLSTLLMQLPLAEIVTYESDEPTEAAINEPETSQNKNEKHFVDNASHETESFININNSPSEKEINKDQKLLQGIQSQDTSDHSPRLETKDINVNKDSDKKQLTNTSNPLTENFIHLPIESSMRSSTFVGSSGYHSDTVVQSLDYFQPSKRRESSSTAPTEISNTSDETHVVGNLIKSNSVNSLVCINFYTCIQEIYIFYRTHLLLKVKKTLLTGVQM